MTDFLIVMACLLGVGLLSWLVVALVVVFGERSGRASEPRYRGHVPPAPMPPPASQPWRSK